MWVHLLARMDKIAITRMKLSKKGHEERDGMYDLITDDSYDMGETVDDASRRCRKSTEVPHNLKVDIAELA